MKTRLLTLMTGWALAVSALAQTKPLYENNFEKAEVGKVPEELMVLNGAFVVQQDAGNKFLELPGDPVDDFSLLFGSSEAAGVAVSARIFGTSAGRRMPAFAVGLNGAGGFELQVAAGKRQLELTKGEEKLASVPFVWTPGTWTMLKLQVRKVKDGEWKIEGKAWKQGGPEPAEWMIAHDEKAEPPAGRALISGHPFSGKPILFDDLKITAGSAK